MCTRIFSEISKYKCIFWVEVWLYNIISSIYFPFILYLVKELIDSIYFLFGGWPWIGNIRGGVHWTIHRVQHSRKLYVSILTKNFTEWSKKKSWCDLEKKCLRNSKIYFDGVFLSIYSHLLKTLELSKLRRKKGRGL